MLRRMKQKEARLQKELQSKDSIAAKTLLVQTEEQYSRLQDKIKLQAADTDHPLKEYIPGLDSMQSALQFVSRAGSKIPGLSPDKLQQFQNLDVQLHQLQGNLQQANEMQQFIKDREQQLKNQFGNYGLGKQLSGINKELYYYQQQIAEYKSLLNDKQKLKEKLLSAVRELPVFQDFMKKHSYLAQLFGLPADYGTPQFIAGLQTRDEVNQLLQQQVSAGGPDAMSQIRQNMQSAQSALNDLKSKISQAGGGSSDKEMPDFKPNNQKTKTFLQRLEYGVSIQTQKTNYLFPVTSDFGLSLGYKLNDKGVIGVGASYKMGWGTDWQNIAITSQGVGLKSFLDWKLKGSFHLAGGYEMNYQSAFNRIDQLKTLNAWQQSGLAGISKVISLKTKFFKRTNMQLLWDFLSYRQLPRTQPFLFRVGYTF